MAIEAFWPELINEPSTRRTVAVFLESRKHWEIYTASQRLVGAVVGEWIDRVSEVRDLSPESVKPIIVRL